MSSSTACFTASGAGTLGLPMLKSNTFSAPISALRTMPYANNSRIALGSAPKPYILSFTICNTSSSCRPAPPLISMRNRVAQPLALVDRPQGNGN